MNHPSVALVASGLADRGIATFRYDFPFMEAGSKRPDPPPVAHATVRAAVTEAARLVPRLALVPVGRSFGGRMTSQAQALEPLPNVRGLAFLAFPLHPAADPRRNVRRIFWTSIFSVSAGDKRRARGGLAHKVGRRRPWHRGDAPHRRCRGPRVPRSGALGAKGRRGQGRNP